MDFSVDCWLIPAHLKAEAWCEIVDEKSWWRESPSWAQRDAESAGVRLCLGPFGVGVEVEDGLIKQEGVRCCRGQVTRFI